MQIEEFFPYKLAVTADVFSRQLASVYGGRHGLSREEWRFLFLLEGSGGVSSLSLSQRTSLDKVQVSRAAARLEEKGLITRTVLGSDRRQRNYSITARGEALFRSAFAAVEARASAILGEMPPDDHAALVRGIAALDQAVARVAAAAGAGGANDAAADDDPARQDAAGSNR